MRQFMTVFSGRPFKKIFTIILLCIGFWYFYTFKVFDGIYLLGSDSNIIYAEIKSHENQEYLKHNLLVQNYYERRKEMKTSILGSMLYKNRHISMFNRRNRTFTVLIWKYYEWLKNRHIFNFGNKKDRNNPLEYCSVKNCKFIGNDDMIDTVDVVVVHIQHGVIPDPRTRSPNQIWVFLSDESPIHSFSMAARPPNYTDWNNIFNWAMTYRSDADVPVPYGRTVALETPLTLNMTSHTIADFIPYWIDKNLDVLVAVLMSNCGSTERMKFLREFQKHIAVDVYGRCSTSSDKRDACPGHFKSDCKTLNKYIFYLVLENSKCTQYLTEKSFSNAYEKGAIPIIFGPPYEDCLKLLPPDSFLYVDNFKTPKDLAEEILTISKDKDALLSYHEWRNNFKVVSEHGFLGSRSYHYCRLCEALNYNDLPNSTYDVNSLRLFLDPSLLCT